MPLDRDTVTFKDYMAAGPGEQIDAAHYDWDWQSPTAAALTGYRQPRPCATAFIGGVNQAHSADTTGDNPWGLVPDELPHMDYAY